MQRKDALPYVSFTIDDALSETQIRDGSQHKYRSVLVGWQCGFEPLFVAVHSYLDVSLEDDEAMELATDFLAERKWFAGEPTDPDYVIR